jgi:hypothetical protein
VYKDFLQASVFKYGIGFCYMLAISSKTVQNFQHHPLIQAGTRTVKIMRMD